MLTEAEAKTKWCPMRRLVEIGNVRINNTEPGTFTLNCIGSACMMWQWDGWMENDSPEKKRGHCGLARL